MNPFLANGLPEVSQTCLVFAFLMFHHTWDAPGRFDRKTLRSQLSRSVRTGLVCSHLGLHLWPLSLHLWVNHGIFIIMALSPCQNIDMPEKMPQDMSEEDTVCVCLNLLEDMPE